MVAENRVMVSCAGCLGDHRCWVCIGSGLIDHREAGVVPCRRCYGSGICYVCQQIPIKDLGRTPTLRVPRLRRKRGIA